MTTEETRLRAARRDLEYMRVRYGTSRPSAKTLLDQFERILDDAEIDVEKKISEAEHDAEMRQEGRLRQAEKREDDARNLAEEFRVNNEALREANEQRRVLREARKRDGSDVEVTIDREYGSFWTIADIEEIAYRLRAAGGTDDTEVKSTTRTFSASVPDPNVVTLGKREVAVAAEPSPKTRLPSWTWREPLLYIGVPLAVFFVLATIFQWWA